MGLFDFFKKKNPAPAPAEETTLQPWGVDQDAEVLLSQPAEFPRGIISLLTSYAMLTSEIKALYIAQMHTPSTDEAPHLLIGVTCTGNRIEAVNGLVAAIGASAYADQIIDFVEVVPNSPDSTSAYLLKTGPFFRQN
ncbi:MAG: enhanced serine sensitivity protein SseB C-terminal domain-containing protein [Cytophagaceae bacterium]|nr:enhanced serine sensitivity protein SseB C-terminal domain-containing protein [Cytophagaceae bacterium]